MDLSAFPLLTSGFVLLVIGGLLAYLRSVPVTVYRYVKSRFVFSIEVVQTDDAFGWLIAWLDQHPSVQRSKRLVIQTRRLDDDQTAVSYSPLGTHFMRHRGKVVWLERNRERQKADGMLMGLWETITLSTLSRRRGFLEDILLEAKAIHDDTRKGKVCIWSLSQYGDWMEIARKQPRPIESVVLADGIVERTLGDIRSFDRRRDWYQEIGVPYRRGFLLYGPPGNGKTSLVFAIASELHRDLAIVSLSTPTLTDDGLRSALARLPNNSILLIEDIDGVFNQRKPVRPDMKLTFSGLLNALDGVATSDGRIMFVTTNFLDRLDPALIRPGRVDVRISIGGPGPEQIAELHRRFFGDLPLEVGTDGLSMAAYQELFLRTSDAEPVRWP
jgi:BCS1-like protein/ATPase family protein associated with various cellular activities (AAA)